MAKTPQIAEATVVRQWAEDHGYEVADRGRFNSDLIRAFNADKENKRNRLYYEPRARKEPAPLGTPNDQPTAPRRVDAQPPRKATAVVPDKAQVSVIDADEIADSIPASVLEMLRAAGGKSGTGNQAVVTIHALVNI